MSLVYLCCKSLTGTEIKWLRENFTDLYNVWIYNIKPDFLPFLTEHKNKTQLIYNATTLGYLNNGPWKIGRCGENWMYK